MIKRRKPLQRNKRPIARRAPIARSKLTPKRGTVARWVPVKRTVEPGIEYDILQIPKSGRTPKQDRARRRRRELAEAARDRDENVIPRYKGRCIAEGVSPVCLGAATDPHELVPVGAGGERRAYNRVPICRACHRAAQGRVGGLRLRFDWQGRSEGLPPAADVPGATLVTYSGEPSEPVRQAWR